MLVEGQEDVGLFNKYFRAQLIKDKKEEIKENKLDEQEYTETSKSLPIFVYGIGGKDNASKFLKLAKDLGIKKMALILDAKSKLDQNNEYECEHCKCKCECKISNQVNLSVDSQLKQEADKRQLTYEIELKKQFPECKIIYLPTSDIRDKKEVVKFCDKCRKISKIKKIDGMFNEKGNLHEIYKEDLEEIFSELYQHFQSTD